MTRSPFDGLARRPLVTLLLVAALGAGGYLPVLNFMSIYIRDELHGSLATAALFVALMHAFRTLFGTGLGVWMKRLASRRALALGLAGMTLLVAALTQSSDMASVFAVAPFAGLAMSLHWMGLQTYLIEIAPPARRGTWAGILGFVLVISPGLVGLLYGLLSQAMGLRAMALLATLLVGAALTGSIFALPPSRPDHSPARQKAPLRAFLQLLRSPAVAPLMVLRASSTLTFATFILLAGPKLVASGGDLRTVGVLTLIASLGSALAQAGIGRLSDAIGRRGLLMSVLVIGGAGAAGFAIADGVALLLILAALYSLASWAVNTLAISLWGDLAPRGALGQLMALDGAAYSLGNLAGALFTFALVSHAPDVPFALAGAAMAAGSLALLWIRPARPSAALPAPGS